MPFASKIVQFGNKSGPDYVPDQVVGQPTWVAETYPNANPYAWFYSFSQITGINVPILMVVGYNDAIINLWYRVDANQYNPGNPLQTPPNANGFAFVANGGGINVQKDQWVTMACTQVGGNFGFVGGNITIQDPNTFDTKYFWQDAIEMTIL